MAISTTTNKAQYSCNGSVTEFDLAVRILDEDDVTVLIKDTTTGAQTELSKTTDFTIAAISGDYDNGARVTTLTTYSSDYEITLLREVDLDQGLDLVEGGDLSAEGLENALDKGVMQAQQIDEKIGRALVAPSTDESGLSYELEAVEVRASKALGFDSSGNVTSLSLAASGTIGVDEGSGLSIDSNIVSITDGGVGTTQLSDDGVTADKLASNAVVAASIVDGTITLAKLENRSNMTVIGNVSGSSATPAEVSIIDDDTMATASATNIPTAESVVAYIGEWQAWTPVVSQGGATNITYTGSGKYIKTGSTVTATANLTITGAGVGSNIVIVSGFPETIADTNILPVGSGIFYDDSTVQRYGCIPYTNGQTIYFLACSTNNEVGQSPSSALATDDKISFTITYQVA